MSPHGCRSSPRVVYGEYVSLRGSRPQHRASGDRLTCSAACAPLGASAGGTPSPVGTCVRTTRRWFRGNAPQACDRQSAPFWSYWSSFVIVPGSFSLPMMAAATTLPLRSDRIRKRKCRTQSWSGESRSSRRFQPVERGSRTHAVAIARASQSWCAAAMTLPTLTQPSGRAFSRCCQSSAGLAARGGHRAGGLGSGFPKSGANGCRSARQVCRRAVAGRIR